MKQSLEWKPGKKFCAPEIDFVAHGNYSFSLKVWKDGRWALESWMFAQSPCGINGQVKESNDPLEDAKKAVIAEYEVREAGLALAFQGMKNLR